MRETLSVGTIASYLIGRRDAILAIASERRAIVVGLLFVLSAGFARDYDGEDLLQAPWHVLVPLVASTIAAAVLILGMGWVARVRWTAEPLNLNRSFRNPWRAMLAAFWMTAPLAWLYAIPYHAFLEPSDAMVANLVTLGIVAAWRVVLMARVIAVLYGFPHLATLFFVLCYGSVALLVALFTLPLPVVGLMSGVRHSGADAVFADVTEMLTLLELPALPLSILLSMVALLWVRPKPAPQELRSGGTSRMLKALIAASLVVWLPFLPFTQPAQVLRGRVDRLLRDGDLESAIALMSSHERADFPVFWSPAPRPSYRVWTPRLEDIAEAMERERPARWVAELYVDKAKQPVKMSEGGARLIKAVRHYYSDIPGSEL